MAIKITFHRTFFTEDNIIDGEIVNGEYRKDVVMADTIDEAVRYIEVEGLNFASTGNDWAADPDGSWMLNYATGMRVEVTATIDAPEADHQRIMELVG